MTCAKRYVWAELTLKNGETYRGTNDCQVPQPACPRSPGEGYTKCREVCRQVAHAEIAAIMAAHNSDFPVRGGHMAVHGIGHVCGDCALMMQELGITWTIHAPLIP